MRNIKNNLLKHAKHIKHFVRPLVVPKKFMHKNMPYFSQWESRELARQILEKKINTDDDPRWKTSGAKTKQEFYFHNPSGTSDETQEYATISFGDFKKFFSGRGIVIQGDSKSG